MAFYSNSLDFPNLTNKASPTTSDIIMIADAAASKVPKQATIASIVSLASSGALTWLASVTASNSATVNFNNNLTSTYDNYVIIFENAYPSAGGTGVQLRLRVGTGATPTYQTSGYVGTNLDINPSTTTANSSGTASFLLNNIATSVTSTIVSGGMVLINNANNASNAKSLTSSISTATSTGTFQLSISGGAWNNSTVLTSLQISYVSGNVSTGTFKLYGYQN
jgi:hypothetical protein